MSKKYTADEYISMINNSLMAYLSSEPSGAGETKMLEAMRYSVENGGKRIRPMLTLEFCRMCGGSVEAALPLACAIEFIHTYSLIHDDLPCMDNDDFRRGKPSCHKQFGEATALLAADALVTAAFEVIANAKLSAESRIEAVQLLSKGGGDRGMLYGQELDKRFETMRASESELLELHAHKTGALIIAAVELGCAAAGVKADTAIRKSLVRYAAEVGLVFQIVDDILDVTSTTEELGKPVGSDANNDKTTFITLYGLQGRYFLPILPLLLLACLPRRLATVPDEGAAQDKLTIAIALVQAGVVVNSMLAIIAR